MPHYLPSRKQPVLQTKGEMTMTDFEEFTQIIDEWFPESDSDRRAG
jgi:hypothetical protein